MLQEILNLESVQKLGKQEQKTIFGKGPFPVCPPDSPPTDECGSCPGRCVGVADGFGGLCKYVCVTSEQ